MYDKSFLRPTQIDKATLSGWTNNAGLHVEVRLPSAIIQGGGSLDKALSEFHPLLSMVGRRA